MAFGHQPGRGREGKTEDPCEGGKKDYLPHWVSKGLRRELKKALDWLTGGFQCRDSSISPLYIHPCLCACCRFYSGSIRWVMCSHLPFLLDIKETEPHKALHAMGLQIEALSMLGAGICVLGIILTLPRSL